jgi:hypothetical protein
MEVAAFAVGCVAILLSGTSLGWQVYTWLRDRRFDIRARVVYDGATVGGRRYPITVVVTNHGGTEEAIEQLWINVTYDDEDPHTTNFYAPELVRHPSRDRSLPPGRRFRSQFNLLSRTISGRAFPKRVVAQAELESRRQIVAEPYLTSESIWASALEDKPLVFEVPEDDDYFPEGPTQPCPDCKSEIPSDARVCRYCGYRYSGSADHSSG